MEFKLSTQASFWKWPLNNGILLALLGVSGFAIYFPILGHEFVFDDFLHIINKSKVVEGFHAPQSLFGRELTYALWRCLYLVFGLNPLPFHFLSLCVHIACAGMFFLVLARLLPRTSLLSDDQFDGRVIAFCSAGLFLVHPMATEAVSYATQLSIQLVALFSLTSVYLLLRWTEKPDPKYALLFVVSSAATCLAKQPGFFHLAINLCFVGVTVSHGPRDQWRRWWSLRGIPFRIAFAVASALALVLVVNHWISIIQHRSDSTEKMFAYFLTQSRVFFEYVWRFFLPIGLSADHHVPWTTGAADLRAVASLVVISAGFSAILYFVLRKRSGLAMIAGLISAHLLIRFFYTVDELMVEYRVYPSLPWVCLSIVLLLSHLAVKVRIPRQAIAAGVGALLLLFGISSHLRTSVWQDEVTLTEDILEKYPKNIRALCFHLNKLHALGQPEKVLEKKQMPDLLAQGIRAWNEEHAENGREFSEGKTFTFHIRCHFPIARALSDLGHHETALTVADKIVGISNPIGKESVDWTSLYLRARIRLEARLPKLAMEDLQMVEANPNVHLSIGYRNEIRAMKERAKALAAADTPPAAMP